MSPGSFDEKTCRALVGDERARVIEAAARSQADKGEDWTPPAARPGVTYWDGVASSAESILSAMAYRKRKDRIARKSAAKESK